ncbi:MAG: glycosyltransferase [Ornithinimicrobium sp.]
MVIGYYVHHHGAGHLTRARVISSQLEASGHRVVMLGSDLGESAGVVLPRDHHGDLPFVEPQAGGALHWAPLGHPGYSERMHAIATWVMAHRPRAVVVDVSVEVTTLLRLLGVPTVVVAQPGDRCDDAHELAFRCATAILAPWPAQARACPAIEAFGSKVAYTGGISGALRKPRPRTVGVVLDGRGGGASHAVIDQLRDQVPGMPWVRAGGGSWVSDIGELLNQARVVITHCGQNAVADVAAIDVPAVLRPQPRPHDEQVYLSSELSRLGLAVAAPEGRTPGRRSRQAKVNGTDWSSTVDEAMGQATQWHLWDTECATERAADLIEAVACG